MMYDIYLIHDMIEYTMIYLTLHNFVILIERSVNLSTGFSDHVITGRGRVLIPWSGARQWFHLISSTALPSVSRTQGIACPKCGRQSKLKPSKPSISGASEAADSSFFGSFSFVQTPSLARLDGVLCMCWFWLLFPDGPQGANDYTMDKGVER